jgi:hypothetical protein
MKLILFLLFGAAAAQCGLQFSILGIDPLYDGDTTTFWAGACGYKLHWCDTWRFLTWTLYEASTGRALQVIPNVQENSGIYSFCFSPGNVMLTAARDYYYQTTVDGVNYSTARYYGKKSSLGITTPVVGQRIQAGSIFDIVYSFTSNAPAQVIAASPILIFTNQTPFNYVDFSFLDESKPPGIGYVQQARIPDNTPPGTYKLASGFLYLSQPPYNFVSRTAISASFTVECPMPPCTNVPFPPPPPPVPASQPATPSPMDRSGSWRLELF